ncbi:MAG: YHS domain-containing (seleno)protein [Burkholderiales bacterium]|nr:YHS domain-containing (seleno)protein [Burkholderiales bacterium]
MNSRLSVSRRTLVAAMTVAGLTVLSIGVQPAWSYDDASQSAVNVDKAGLAIRGYDPVAYFAVGKPTPGLAQFTAKHEGATYQFANAANRDAFAANPAKYAPAFGGFCAMGAVFQKKLDGDPNLWRVVDGKLYLNVGEPAQKRWLEDVPGNITKASQNWPVIRGKAPKDL